MPGQHITDEQRRKFMGLIEEKHSNSGYLERGDELYFQLFRYKR